MCKWDEHVLYRALYATIELSRSSSDTLSCSAPPSYFQSSILTSSSGGTLIIHHPPMRLRLLLNPYLPFILPKARPIRRTARSTHPGVSGRLHLKHLHKNSLTKVSVATGVKVTEVASYEAGFVAYGGISHHASPSLSPRTSDKRALKTLKVIFG